MKRNDIPKINGTLCNSLLCMFFLCYGSFYTVFVGDELGIGGYISYVLLIQLVAMMTSDFGIQKKLKISLWTICFCLACFISPILLLYLLLPYFMWYIMRKIIEKSKLQTRHPHIFNGLADLSLFLFLCNILLVVGIVIYDHRIFGYIKPFWK